MVQNNTKSKVEEELFLGLDFGTQSMKSRLINASLEMQFQYVVDYDKDLPEFQTKNGVYLKENSVVTAPSVMFARALDMTFNELQKQNIPIDKVVAISGSGQQHGSVYWRKGAQQVLKKLNPLKTVSQQLQEHAAFIIEDAPIWMDSSTTEQCQRLEKAVGGPQALAELTGSRAYERFTASQISKIATKNKSAFESCEQVSLISSYIPSLLIGDYAPIDFSDGSGMNLLNISTKTWSEEMLAACSPSLVSRLIKPVASHTVLGSIHDYYQQRYGFTAECKVIAWSGDNPNSIAGLGIQRVGDIGVSLGTSDTFFGISAVPRPGIIGHVFVNPIDPSSYMTMLCFKNGSLMRSSVRDQCANGDWDTFDNLMQTTSPGNQGNLGLYFAQPEITPSVQKCGIWRFNRDGIRVEAFDPAIEIRAVVEGQFLSMRYHAEQIGINNPTRIIATGGAATNMSLLQVLSDMFNVPVFIAPDTDSACIGAAYRALHGYRCWQEQKFLFFDETIAPTSGELKVATYPSAEAYEVYTSMIDKYKQALKRLQAEL